MNHIISQALSELSLDSHIHITPDLEIQIAPHIDSFEYFSNFPYEAWKPAAPRVAFIKHYATGERLLDIACGGHPVTANIHIPYKAGMDISPKAALMPKDQFQDFYLCDFTQTSAKYLQRLGTFDTIVCSEFLEHTKNPAAVIQKILPLMHSRSKLLITVPSGESIAMRIDKYTHNGNWHRFDLFHKTHLSLLPLPQWQHLFATVGLDQIIFDFRPSDLIENFPKENFPGWKNICSYNPRYLAHQYFFGLQKKK